MTTTPKDRGQKFSGQGNAAKRVTPRTNGPAGGGTQDVGEAVVFDRWVDQDANAEQVVGKRQLGTDVTTDYRDRSIGTGDQPVRRPRDAPKNSTTPIAQYSDDSADVGVSSGQYFGSSGEVGEGEIDW